MVFSGQRIRLGIPGRERGSKLMAVVAFVDGTNWIASVIDHAVWAATTLGQPLVIVARENVYDAEPLISYDAYEEMNAQDDMFRELSARPGIRSLESDAAAMELVQSAARRAKDCGKSEPGRHLTAALVYREPTDSGDLLVIARHDGSESTSRQWLDRPQTEKPGDAACPRTIRRYRELANRPDARLPGAQSIS